ncbi:unnamed protein product, partial [Rodentolepis nana]|uniref:HAUS augmin-like complex subunit 7 n=1 Tax=Rodentolepis nana TaxID=102285 RepID=A0A0R3T327_RODNA
GKDVSTECCLTTEALRKENRDLSESITGAADICVDILRHLSALQSKVPLHCADASQPSYMAEITELREKLEEAEHFIGAESPPLDSHICKWNICCSGDVAVATPF